jgi:hypothetical protein
MSQTEATARVNCDVDDIDAAAEKFLADNNMNFDAEVCSTGKPRNYITQLIFELENSLIQLKAKNLTISKLEEMAILIFESMSISTRNYHSVQHVFDLINHDDRLQNYPIAIVSACFHDCIYYHVDGGLTPVQAVLLEGSYKIIGPSVKDMAETDYLHTQQIYKFFATDREEEITEIENPLMLLQMVETIFGYAPGYNIKITMDGLNEFLSAVVAVRMLKDHLPIEMLAQIACCIEATIPFRPVDKVTGKTHMDKLFDNMKKARQLYDLKLSDEDLISSVQRACLISNSDVGNFGTTDRLWFLDNAWSLLPELNESLRNQYVYSVDHFHVALFKMYGFYGFLQPEVVFHDFQGVPAPDELNGLVEECRHNLAFGRTYVGAKLVAMSFVSALAVLSGGDAPISLFTGDLRPTERRRSQVTRRLSTGNGHRNISLLASAQSLRAYDFFKNKTFGLSQIPLDGRLQNCNLLVYEILAEGRRSESSFDTKRSPWAALLYGQLGDDGLNRILKEHTLYPMTEERAWSLLRALPLEPVQTIIQTISEQALSRADKICELFSRLESDAGNFTDAPDAEGDK